MNFKNISTLVIIFATGISQILGTIKQFYTED